MVEKKSTSTSRNAALAALFAAAYAVGVFFLAPISFQIFQVRVADALLPLSILFGPPAIIGLTLGNIVGNISSPFGVIDIVGGTVANLVASSLAWWIGRRKFKGAWLTAVLAEVLTITLVVGTYLAFLIQVPVWLSWLGVLIGEAVAVGLGGYLLLRSVSRILKGRA